MSNALSLSRVQPNSRSGSNQNANRGAPVAQSRHVRVIPQRHRDLYTKGNAFAYFLFSIPCQQPPTPRISAIHSMRIKLSSVEGPPCASQPTNQPPKRAGTNLVVWNASFSSNHGKEYKTAPVAPLLPFRDTLLKNFKLAAPETAALHLSPPLTDSARVDIFSRMKFPSIGLTAVIEAPNF